MSYLGTLLPSFPDGEKAVRKLLEMMLGRKRIERLSERIGGERVEERDAEIDLFRHLTLMQKIAGPAGVKAPAAAAVMADGGRFQKTMRNEDSRTHWYEYKAGLCAVLKERPDGLAAGEDAPDPLPEVPKFLLDVDKIETLTREIGKKAADVPEPDETLDEGISLEEVSSLEQLEQIVAAADESRQEDSKKKLRWSPQLECRDVVATTAGSDEFGLHLAARSWSLGLSQAARKAFVADGSAWLWTIFERWFKPFGFAPVLDLMHAAAYVYAAAMAGRSRREGSPVYRRWITWIWQGEVAKVIAELARRQEELGLPTDDDGETSPCRIMDRSLTYLQNQKSRMDYPRYRKLGLPITSSLMESTVKQLNRRIKGTEKFWTDQGAEAMLQMKADTLSDSDPLTAYWTRRQTRQTGLRRRCRRPTPAAA